MSYHRYADSLWTICLDCLNASLNDSEGDLRIVVGGKLLWMIASAASRWDGSRITSDLAVRGSELCSTFLGNVVVLDYITFCFIC